MPDRSRRTFRALDGLGDGFRRIDYVTTGPKQNDKPDPNTLPGHHTLAELLARRPTHGGIPFKLSFNSWHSADEYP